LQSAKSMLALSARNISDDETKNEKLRQELVCDE